MTSSMICAIVDVLMSINSNKHLHDLVCRTKIAPTRWLGLSSSMGWQGHAHRVLPPCACKAAIPQAAEASALQQDPGKQASQASSGPKGTLADSSAGARNLALLDPTSANAPSEETHMSFVWLSNM